jgi:hypothetical protein
VTFFPYPAKIAFRATRVVAVPFWKGEVIHRRHTEQRSSLARRVATQPVVFG